jgi:hypothetical protein
MRRLSLLAASLLIVCAAAVALTSGPAFSFGGFTGDLSALPGCAGQCHTKGHFYIDKRTGRKIPLGGGGGGGQTVCRERNACGPVFCQRQRICCDGAGNCTTTNLGAN